MTVDQRAELLKRVVTDEPHKKLSYGECREIANDLNLTVEQVCLLFIFFLGVTHYPALSINCHKTFWLNLPNSIT